MPPHFQSLFLPALLLLSAGCAQEAPAGDVLVSNFWTSTVDGYRTRSGDAGGSLTGGPLVNPLCARIGPDGMLYVASEGNDSILRYDPRTLGYVDTFVAAGAGGLDGPTGVTWGKDGHLYVPSFNTDSVLKFDGTSGAFLSVFIGPGLGGLNGPDNGTTFGPDGNLYVPAYYSNRIIRYDGVSGALMGNFVATIARPRVLVFHGNSLYVTTETNHSVKRYDAITGAFIADFIPRASGGLNTPVGLVFASDGKVYVGSSGTNQILRYDGVSGAFQDVFAGDPTEPINGPVFITERAPFSEGPGPEVIVPGHAERIRR